MSNGHMDRETVTVAAAARRCIRIGCVMVVYIPGERLQRDAC